MQSKDLFPLFGWAKARRNPPQVSKTELKVISKNPTQVPSHKSNFQNDQEKSPIKKLKVATAQSRTKFYQDIDAQNRMKMAYDAYQQKALLPNGQKPSIRNCASSYGVSSSTLSYRTSGLRSATSPRKPDRPPIFNKEELQKIANHLLTMADLGYGYTEIQAMNLIRHVRSLGSIKNQGQEKDFKASYGFMSYLFIQFPELSLHKEMALEYQRATILNQNSVICFFDVLEKAYQIGIELSGKEIDPVNVWTTDEIGFSLFNGEIIK